METAKSLGCHNCPTFNVQAGRLPSSFEKRRFRCRHPHLAAALKPLEERRSSLRIEMGRNLVEKEDRRLAAPLRHEIGMREDEAEQ